MTRSINISFSSPLDRAWKRMKSTLFQPFSLGHWLVLGFTAFLADLDSGFGGNSGGTRFSEKLHAHQSGEWLPSATALYERTTHSGWLTILAGFLLLVGLVLGILILWFSCRGRFMFLDNLVTGRAEVVRPWNEFAAEGNSLFKWQLVFALACLLVFGVFAWMLILLFVPLGAMGAGAAVTIPLVMLAGTLAFCLVVIAVYVEFFLHSFVVTIMYRDRITATEAWSRFKPLFSLHPGTFAVYGLFYLVLAIIGVAALLLGGALACCLGLVLLMIPYIGSVISLPLSVTLRYLDLEFLGQFGSPYQVLGAPARDPDHRSIYDDGNGTVVGPEDVGENPGAAESGPEGP